MKVKQTLAAIIVLSAAATQTERTAGCLIRSHGNWYLPHLAAYWIPACGLAHRRHNWHPRRERSQYIPDSSDHRPERF